MATGEGGPTSIVDVNQDEDEGPDEDDEDGRPAANIAVRASPDGDDEVAAVMDDVVQSHYEKRDGEADGEVGEDFPPSLRAGGIY